MIPVLIQTGPVEDIGIIDLFLWIHVEPPLAPFFLRPAIPGDAKSLISPARKLN